MTKYVELPQKPRVIHAIQFLGLKDGVPEFNEAPAPWVLAAFARGYLKVNDEQFLDQLVSDGLPVNMGDWLVAQDNNGPDLETFHVLSGPRFVGAYRPARKKPAARAPKAAATTKKAA